ncbi:DoxX-like family protein [Sphingomonas bacterium]|uniref:DoxX-like family protein n=1 Tax=Sphingomonas bacterium TaxID=1895847 RepID=UPI00157551EA|nr:DoxX-like family protein [Sphingomonas bacterium]
MLEAGNAADVAPFVAACGFRPALLEQALARSPATPADLLAARLLPLAPVLRVLLAPVWRAGGLVPRAGAAAADSARPEFRAARPDRDHRRCRVAALPTLVAASLLDIAIGLALLARFRVRAVAIAVMAGYSAILPIAFPVLWAGPFGPLVKNVAVLGLALAVRAGETDHG